MPRVTLRDVAKISGVSHMTVSRVINNDPQVSAKTRQRVMDVIHKCKYTPNISARALISGETKVLGVLVLYDIGRFPADFMTTILLGISSELSKADYHFSLYFDQLNGKHDLVPPHLLTANRMDGLFVITVETHANLMERIGGISLPMVVVNDKIASPHVSCVDSDEFSGAYGVTEHFIKLGRRRIAFIGGDPQYNTSVARREGYEAALADNGIKFDPKLCGVGYYTSTGGFKAAAKLLESGRKIDAIFAANDAMAVGVMTALRQAGLSIPGDVALAGFDDNEFSLAAFPPLTTVRKYRVEMGVEAAKIMLETIAHNRESDERLVIRKTLPTKVIIRESSGDAAV